MGHVRKSAQCNYLKHTDKKENLVQEIKRITEDRDRGKGYSPTRQCAVLRIGNVLYRSEYGSFLVDASPDLDPTLQAK